MLRRECFLTRISGCRAEITLDPEKLIVFGNPLTPRRCTGLDLPGIECYGKIRNGRILRLARAMDTIAVYPAL